MENINKEEINNFIRACNDLIYGKFILVDIKITSVLKSIAESADIYNILAECMINFDFAREFSKAKVSTVSDTTFKLPMEVHKIIPLVFCLLVEIDSKRIDFDQFLRTQFPYADNQKDEYTKFANNIIVPFRDAIASLFDMPVDIDEKRAQDEEVNIIDKQIAVISGEGGAKAVVEKTTIASVEETPTPALTQEEDDVNDFFASVKEKVHIVEEKLSFVKNKQRRDNIKTITTAILQTCDIKNITILNALVYALNCECKQEKIMKETIHKLNNLYFTYFS